MKCNFLACMYKSLGRSSLITEILMAYKILISEGLIPKFLVFTRWIIRPFCLVIVLIHGSWGVSWLGTTSPLSHDDLVNSEYSAGSVAGILDGPLLTEEQVIYTRLGTILRQYHNIFIWRIGRSFELNSSKYSKLTYNK